MYDTDCVQAGDFISLYVYMPFYMYIVLCLLEKKTRKSSIPTTVYSESDLVPHFSAGK